MEQKASSQMKIAMGADHAGYELKEKLKEYLKREGYDVIDVGAHEYQPGDDYPVYAAAAAEKVARGEADRGVVVCDSGIGVYIVANKVPGVRSALVHNEDLAARTREHNDTNVLALGSMSLGEDEAKRIAKTWLETAFSHGERHERRVREIEQLEKEEAQHA
jgi:ribose 5-phosphate isomerase B